MTDVCTVRHERACVRRIGHKSLQATQLTVSRHRHSPFVTVLRTADYADCAKAQWGPDRVAITGTSRHFGGRFRKENVLPKHTVALGALDFWQDTIQVSPVVTLRCHTPPSRSDHGKLPTEKRPPTMTSRLTVIVFLWVTLVGVGIYTMLDYEFTPGESGTPPQQWPAAASVELDSTQPTLLMFIHPHCPCTRASIRELSLLLSNCGNQVRTHVVFVQPDGTSEDWAQTDLWTSVGRLPGVERVVDLNNQLTTTFAMRTSGEVLLYTPQGSLQFHGGLTASRGHQGENVGRSTLTALLQQANPSSNLSLSGSTPRVLSQDQPSPAKTLAFGCPLCEHATDKLKDN